MMRAWYMDNSDADQRLEHHRQPAEFVSLKKLFATTGVEYFKVRSLLRLPVAREFFAILRALTPSVSMSDNSPISISLSCLVFRNMDFLSIIIIHGVIDVRRMIATLLNVERSSRSADDKAEILNYAEK